MQALLIEQPGKACLGQIAVPTLTSDNVLLRIHTVGFCGTDLAIFRGANPLASYPRVPGHEIAGVIVEKGSDVPDKFQPGMNVTLTPLTSCGNCPACKHGRVNCCRETRLFGVHCDGGMTVYLAVPWQSLYTSRKLSPRELALVEPLTIGFHAVARARITPADTVAVIGCGAIGLGAMAGAVAQGARIIAIDIESAKLALAQKVGAQHAINSKTEPLHQRLLELTDGHGPDVVLEAVGSPETFRCAVDEVAHGGRVVYVGWSKPPVTYDTKNFIFKELDILGSRNSLPADYHNVIAHLEAGRFPVNDVISKTVPLSDSAEALREWHANPAEFTKIQVLI